MRHFLGTVRHAKDLLAQSHVAHALRFFDDADDYFVAADQRYLFQDRVEYRFVSPTPRDDATARTSLRHGILVNVLEVGKIRPPNRLADGLQHAAQCSETLVVGAQLERDRRRVEDFAKTDSENRFKVLGGSDGGNLGPQVLETPGRIHRSFQQQCSEHFLRTHQRGLKGDDRQYEETRFEGVLTHVAVLPKEFRDRPDDDQVGGGKKDCHGAV